MLLRSERELFSPAASALRGKSCSGCACGGSTAGCAAAGCGWCAARTTCPGGGGAGRTSTCTEDSDQIDQRGHGVSRHVDALGVRLLRVQRDQEEPLRAVASGAVAFDGAAIGEGDAHLAALRLDQRLAGSEHEE